MSSQQIESTDNSTDFMFGEAEVIPLFESLILKKLAKTNEDLFKEY